MVQDPNFDKKSRTNLSEGVAWYSLVLKKQKSHYDEHGWCILPTVIPSTLLDLTREKGLKLRRWIEDNNLQGKENKKIIKPDKNLESLLNVKKGDDINFFSMQKYMNKHFVTK